MTVYDASLAHLAERIDALSRPARSALFAACAGGLMPAFDRWEVHAASGTRSTLIGGIEAGWSFARTGIATDDASGILRAMERSTPPGENPDRVSSTSAQDCWICADVAVRVMVDPRFGAGPAIEYALEPSMQLATLRLHGVSQHGNTDDGNVLVSALVDADEVAGALAFCDWAVLALTSVAIVDDELADELRIRSGALLPAARG